MITRLLRSITAKNFPFVPPVRPAVKIVIVLAGFALALAVALVAMGIRQQLNASDPSQGMQAFGDLVLGVLVFTVLALVPLGLGLHWLRPVTCFWTVLASVAALLDGAIFAGAILLRLVLPAGH